MGPISDAPCRRCGTAEPVSRPNRKPPHRPRLSPRRVLAGATRRNRNAFRRIADARLPGSSSRGSVFETNTLLRPLAPLSLSTGPLRASARKSEISASVRSPSRLAALRATWTRDASDRRLPSHVSVRVPAPRWFSMNVIGFRPCVIEGLPASRAAQFASAGRRNGRASDTSVASPPLTRALARNGNDGSRRDRMKRAA